MPDGKTNLWRELKLTLRLAGPIVVGNIGQVLIGVVDTLMIGRVGVAELGAVSFVNNLFLIPLVSSIGFLAAVPILVSQARGSGDQRQVGRYVKHAMLLTALASLAITALLVVNGFFLDRYGQAPEVVEASRGYYWLIVATLLPSLLYQCLKGMSEGLGWSDPPMVALMSGIGLNVALNWILIFGKLGFPELGLIGAGWATLISRWAIVLGMLAYVLRAGRYAGYLPRRWWRGYRLGEFSGVLRMGIPLWAQHLFEIGAFAGAGVVIGWISKEALAAHQVAMSLAALAFMVPLGVSVATSVRVGETFGAGDLRRLRVICLGSIGFSLMEASFVALSFLVFGEWLAALFVQDAQVVSAAASILVVVGVFQIFDGVQVSSIGALRGMSDVTVPMWVTFVAYWVIALPVGYVVGIARGVGATGVWIGLALGLFCAAVLLVLRLWIKAR